MLSGKSALSDLQERGTQAAFLTLKSSTFFPSSPTQSQSLVFTPGNFLELYHLRLHLLFVIFAIDFCIHIPLGKLETSQIYQTAKKKKLGTGGI